MVRVSDRIISEPVTESSIRLLIVVLLIAINGFFAFATVVFAGAAVGNGGRMSDFYKRLGIVIGVTFTLFGFAIYRWFKRKPGAVAIPFATVPLIFGGLWLYVIFISDVK